jgi:hypothetical protein
MTRGGCCQTWPKPCAYHEGSEDERDAIIQYLRRFPDNTRNEILFDVADRIEAGTHVDGSSDG